MANISKDAIKAYALENAVKYKGKANQGSVLAGLFAEGLEKSEVKEIMPKIKEVIDEVNSMSVDEQKKELEIMEFKTSKREVREVPPLPNAEEKKSS
jgi:glutamyl-tRNA synthetase